MISSKFRWNFHGFRNFNFRAPRRSYTVRNDCRLLYSIVIRSNTAVYHALGLLGSPAEPARTRFRSFGRPAGHTPPSKILEISKISKKTKHPASDEKSGGCRNRSLASRAGCLRWSARPQRHGHLTCAQRIKLLANDLTKSGWSPGRLSKLGQR